MCFTVYINDSECNHVCYSKQPLPTGCRPLPLPLHIATAGKNHLNADITPLLPSGIGARYCQTISNLGHALLLNRCELPYKRMCRTNSGCPLVNSLLWAFALAAVFVHKLRTSPPLLKDFTRPSILLVGNFFVLDCLLDHPSFSTSGLIIIFFC